MMSDAYMCFSAIKMACQSKTVFHHGYFPRLRPAPSVKPMIARSLGSKDQLSTRAHPASAMEPRSAPIPVLQWRNLTIVHL